MTDRTFARQAGSLFLSPLERALVEAIGKRGLKPVPAGRRPEGLAEYGFIEPHESGEIIRNLLFRGVIVRSQGGIALSTEFTEIADKLGIKPEPAARKRQ